MNRRALKHSPTPRYITIRIRYYPPDKKLIFSLFLFIFFSAWQYYSSQLVTQWHGFFTKDTFLFARYTNVYTAQTLQTVFTLPKLELKLVEQALPKNDHVINNGSREKKKIALTFDADMTPEMKKALLSGMVDSWYNKHIVDILNETQTKATVFMTGMWIEMYPEVMEELAANPLFEFGNHSYSHPGFDGVCWGLTPSPDENNQKEIQKTQELLRQYTHKDATLFRFPGGCYSQKDFGDVTRDGLYVVHWDSVGNDGFNDDVEKIESNVLSSAQNGSIIVLHFNGPPNSPLTDQALPTIISILKERGFEFVKVSELLGLDEILHNYSSSEAEGRIEKLTQLFSTVLEQ